MEKNIISEEEVKKMVDTLIFEETSKVSRQDFSRIQFKIEELQNSLNETLKEYKKLNDSIPDRLKLLTSGRMSGILQNLSNSQKLTVQLKEKINRYKKSIYSSPVVEKNKEN